MISIVLPLKSLVNSFPGLVNAVKRTVARRRLGQIDHCLRSGDLWVSDSRAPQSAGDVGTKYRLSLQRAIFSFTLCCRSCTFTSISYVEEVRENDE